jgi:hypothetical protein
MNFVDSFSRQKKFLSTKCEQIVNFQFKKLNSSRQLDRNLPIFYKTREKINIFIKE